MSQFPVVDYLFELKIIKSDSEFRELKLSMLYEKHDTFLVGYFVLFILLMCISDITTDQVFGTSQSEIKESFIVCKHE